MKVQFVMQRRIALIAVLVIGVTIFVTSSSVFGQGQGGSQGSPLAAIQEQLNSIQSIVQSNEQKIDALTTDILFIKAALIDESSGLQEIKAEVASIETTVNIINTSLDTANAGIGTIQTEILSLDLTPLGGIATIQSTLDDPDTGLPAIQTEILSLDLSGADPYTLVLDYDIALNEVNRKNIVLGIFSECDETDCPFTVDTIFLRPDDVSLPSVIMVCSDDVETVNVAPNCVATLADGGSLGVGISTTLSFGIGGSATLPIPFGELGLDLGPSFGVTLPIGFNQPLWAVPNTNAGILGSEVLGSSGVGSIKAKQFVTVMLFNFAGKITIDGEKDPGVEVKAVIMDSLKDFGTVKGTSTGLECDTECQNLIKKSCFGLCTASSPGTFVSYDSLPRNPTIRNVVFTQNDNQRSDTIPIVTQSPQFGSNNNQFFNPPKPVAFGDVAIPDTLIKSLIKDFVKDATSVINMKDIVDALDTDQIGDEVDKLTSLVPTLVAKLKIPNLIGDISDVIDDIEDTANSLVNTIDNKVVGPIEGLVDDITSVTDQVSGLKSDVNDAFTSINNDLISPLNKFDPSISKTTLSSFPLPTGVNIDTKSINPCKGIKLLPNCSFTVTTGVSLIKTTKSIVLPAINLDPNFNIPPLPLIGD